MVSPINHARITDVATTVLRQPDLVGIQDATIRHREMGRSALFVHIKTDAGYEGLGVGHRVPRGLGWLGPDPAA